MDFLFINSSQSGKLLIKFEGSSINKAILLFQKFINKLLLRRILAAMLPTLVWTAQTQKWFIRCDKLAIDKNQSHL